MSDIVNCDGMSDEEARAALRRHVQESEDARQAERERAALARAANAARLGFNESGIPVRPARYARAVGDALPLTVNGTPARLIRSSARWEGWDTDFPHRILEGVAVVGRHKVYKLRLALDGEDLTRETAWLTMRDAVAVGGGRVRFVSGFEAELFPEFMAEAEARDDRAVLAAVADIEAAGVGAGNADPLPGWRRGKLVLKKCPNGPREPGVFTFGSKTYTVPGGKAWQAVCDLIRADAFDGHGLEMPSPSECFRGSNRPFFCELLTKGAAGWYIKTQ